MPADDGYRERRKFVRFFISIPLKYAKIGIEKLVGAHTCDISAKGIGLITTEELPVNTPLNICLKIPDNDEEIPLEAEVAWSRQLDKSRCRSGLRLKNVQIKPVPLVLRTIQSML